MIFHHRISPQMYIKITGWAKSHHTVMQKKTKRMYALVLTDIAYYTRIT